MEALGWVILGLAWWLMAGDFLLRWTGGEGYTRWKLRSSIGRTLLVVLLWPLFVK